MTETVIAARVATAEKAGLPALTAQKVSTLKTVAAALAISTAAVATVRWKKE